MSTDSRINILIFDPERDAGELFARALESRRNCRCYLASSVEETLDLLRGGIPFTLMILDLKAAMTDDYLLLKQARRASPQTTVIVVGYLHQKDHILKAMTLGARGHIIKPIKLDAFRKKIEEFTLGSATSTM
ncbi:MAG: response regulator [Syntrophobacteraceae bacterium]|nr:response regulator [Syntrophobacteraceae bacterium]